MLFRSRKPIHTHTNTWTVVDAWRAHLARSFFEALRLRARWTLLFYTALFAAAALYSQDALDAVTTQSNGLRATPAVQAQTNLHAAFQRLSYDEAYLFTASEEGHIFMLELRGDGAALRDHTRRKEEDEPFSTSDPVLVSRSEILERLAGSDELERKVKDLTMQAEYQAHLREQQFGDELKCVKDEAERRLEEGRDRKSVV